MWLIVDVGLVAVLGAALFYGMAQYRHRSRDMKQRTDEATRRLYRQER
jgi:hypothetical protein